MAFEVDGLDEKVVMVTGASSGIGREIALEFARQGADVVVHYNSGRERAHEVATAIEAMGGRALTVKADVRDDGELRSAVEEVESTFGRLDVLVNNAGDPVRRVPFRELDVETLDAALAVNLRGPFVLTRLCAALLESSRGVVLNISTGTTLRGSSGDNLHYGVAKGGLNTLTIGLARELGPVGVRVNSLAPGITDTELHDRVSAPDRLRAQAAETLLGRYASAQEIAQIAVFLCSSQAAFIHGQVIFATGG